MKIVHLRLDGCSLVPCLFLRSLFLLDWVLVEIQTCFLFLALAGDRSSVTVDHSGSRGCRRPCSERRASQRCHCAPVEQRSWRCSGAVRIGDTFFFDATPRICNDCLLVKLPAIKKIELNWNIAYFSSLPSSIAILPLLMFVNHKIWV